jgi:DNA invertase Pin-like site-specific DNA recombinase
MNSRASPPHAKRYGSVVRYYIDEGMSGRTSERPAFIDMRRDAKSRRFDALIVHKFDRFARNRTNALAIKSLLRHDYGIKVIVRNNMNSSNLLWHVCGLKMVMLRHYHFGQTIISQLG